MHSIDRDGHPTWRATSSSGGTQPRRFIDSENPNKATFDDIPVLSYTLERFIFIYGMVCAWSHLIRYMISFYLQYIKLE